MVLSQDGTKIQKTKCIFPPNVAETQTPNKIQGKRSTWNDGFLLSSLLSCIFLPPFLPFKAFFTHLVFCV